MQEAPPKPVEQPTPRPDQDPVAAGRAGGIASGEARRRRYVDRLRAKVLTDSGMGSYAAYRTWLEDLDERERKVGQRELALSDAQERLCRLRDEADQERQRAEREQRRLEALRERGDRLEAELSAEINELGRVRDELRAEVEREAAAHGFDVIDDGDPDSGAGAGGSAGTHGVGGPIHGSHRPGHRTAKTEEGDAASAPSAV